MPTFAKRKKEPILTLIQFGRFDAVTKRLKKGVKAEGKGKSSPKSIANELERVANQEDGLLPIHWACKNGTRLPRRALKALIDASPQTVKSLDSENSTPLHFLVYYGFSSMDTLKLLVKEYPEAIILRDQCGRTPVFHAVEHGEGQKLQVLELLLGSNMKAADMLTLSCGPLDEFPMCPTESRGFKFKRQNYSFQECDRYWTRPAHERCPLHMMWSMALSLDVKDDDDNNRKLMNMPRMHIIQRSHGLKMQKALLLLEFAYLNQVGGAVELRRALWRRRMAKKMIFSKRQVEQVRARSEGDMTNEDDLSGQGTFSFRNGRQSISPTRTAILPMRELGTRTILTPTGTPQSSHKSLRRAQTLELQGSSRRRAETVDVVSSSRPVYSRLNASNRNRASTVDAFNLRHTKSEGPGRSIVHSRRFFSKRNSKRKGAKGAFKRISVVASDVRKKFRKGKSSDSLVVAQDEVSFSSRDDFLSASVMGMSNMGMSEDFSQYLLDDEVVSERERDAQPGSIAGRRRRFKKKKFRPFRNKRKYKQGEAVKFRIVHAVVLFNEYLPKEVIDFALLLKPEQLQQADECMGNLPLHIAASINANPDVVEKLVHYFEDSTALSNSNGQLPLHMSLCARLNMTSNTIDENDAINIDTVHILVKAYPEALAVIDPVTGLFPFMLAAANLTINSNGSDVIECPQKMNSFYDKMMNNHSLSSTSKIIFENQSFRGSSHSRPESLLSTESSMSRTEINNEILQMECARDRLTIVYQLLLLSPECCELY